MEDLWKRAKGFAEEATKKSQSLAASSAASSKISDLFSETAKRSRELAAEASKKADLLKSAAIKQADQIKTLSSDLIDAIPPQLSQLSISSAAAAAATFASPSSSESESLKFGITDDLAEFVKGLTAMTFQSFPVEDESESAEADVSTTAANVRKDLTEWQEKHATLVLTIVKQMSKLRYELCPRIMKEQRFWKIYFTLVSSYVAPYERQYMDELKLKEAEQKKEDNTKQTSAGGSENEEGTEKNLKSQTSKSSTAEQDLDTFLLGDLEESDGGPDDDGEESFGDDFDKIDNSDVEDEKRTEK